MSDIQTAEQIEAEFRRELQALLDKYDADLEAKDHYQGWAECGEDVRMTVDIPAIYDCKGSYIRPWVEIDLGSCICHTDQECAKDE